MYINTLHLEVQLQLFLSILKIKCEYKGLNDAYNTSYIEISWYDVSPLSFLIQFCISQKQYILTPTYNLNEYILIKRA